MSKYAIINNNVVTKVVTLNIEEDIQWWANRCQNIIDLGENLDLVEPGFLLQVNKIVPPPGYQPLTMKITKLAFRQRITVNEMVGIYTAAASNTVLKILLDNLQIATYIDLLRTDTISGIMYIASLGLLTEERANIILTTPPSDIEKYIT